MNNASHLRILAVILALLGIVITAYQVFALKTPLRETEHATLWTVDTRITFDAREAKPVELRFFVPPLSGAYRLSNELFIANGYGQSVFDDGQNRLVVWTARKVSGPQTLFYRMNLAKSTETLPAAPGETWCAPLPVDEVDKLAVDTLLGEIRQKSADTISFITTAVQKVNETQNPNVKLLVGPSETPLRRLRVLELLLSQAHIPIEAAYTLHLSEDGKPEPELWVRSYIDSAKHQDADWYYFSQDAYTKGLPPERVLWWTGDEPLIRASGVRPQVDFRLDRNELTARSLEEVTGGGSFSLYSLPLSTQYAYRLMLMIPFGVFIILILRNIVGLETLGTFTPVLIALAFRETGLTFGLVFFSLIVSVGLLLRAYLEQLKLQMLPRLSVVLSCVIILIIAASLLCCRLGFDAGLSITLFPMVILTMVIERVSVTWEERGGYHAFRVSLGTMAAAAVVYLVLNIQSLAYFVFTFPTVLLVLVAAMLGIGRYRGYRLTELSRFKDLIKRG